MDVSGIASTFYTKKGLPNPNRKPFSISYFGAQARFANYIQSLIPPESVRYIDLVAGGMDAPI
jgi:hypothetical protein